MLAPRDQPPQRVRCFLEAGLTKQRRNPEVPGQPGPENLRPKPRRATGTYLLLALGASWPGNRHEYFLTYKLKRRANPV